MDVNESPLIVCRTVVFCVWEQKKSSVLTHIADPGKKENAENKFESQTTKLTQKKKKISLVPFIRMKRQRLSSADLS